MTNILKKSLLFLKKYKIYLLISLFTILIAIPRFGHITSDVKHYINLAKFFRGNIEAEQLRDPFCYRILIPFLSSLLPFSLELNFTIINILITIIAYFIFVPYLKEFTDSEEKLYFGIFILVISFPTFNYSSSLLTDPGSFLIIITSLYFLIKGRYFLFSLVLSIGVLIRESALFMVLVILLLLIKKYRSYSLKKKITMSITIIPPIIVFFLVRIIVSSNFNIPSSGRNVFIPSLSILFNNLTDPISWTTFLLTLLPLLILYLIGVKFKDESYGFEIPQEKKIIIQTTIQANIIFFLYAIIMATMSGRFIWSIYPAFIPIVVNSFCKTNFFKKYLNPLLKRIIGKSQN